MVNFYHRFIPHAAAILQPLFGTTAGKVKLLYWTPDMLTAFEQAKATLAKATMLVHPRKDAFTVDAVTVDASALAIGAVLEQFIGTSWQPLAFFSRQPRPPERKYSAFDRELLALHLAIRPLPILFGGPRICCLYRPQATYFCFGKVSDHWSPWQQRHLACISEFTTNVHHVAGKENHVADALSRCLVNSIHMQIGVDYATMATAQRTGDEMAAYRASDTGLILQDVPFGSAGDTLLCDMSNGQSRPIVPAACRRQVSDAMHNLSHPAVQATRSLITNKFVWKGIGKQVSDWANCFVSDCQNPAPRQGTTRDICHPGPPFWPHARWFGWTAPVIARFHLSVYNNWSFHQIAWSCSTDFHVLTSLCTHIH